MSTVATTPTVTSGTGKYDSKSPDHFKSKSPDKQEKKPLMDKLENRLTMKDLNKLQRAFMTEGDGYDNKLALYRDQFCEALSILLEKGTREEYGELFDKVDVAREGSVDWDKFASHMLLEFYEKDDRVKSTQVPQWKDLKSLPSPHKDVIQKVVFLKNTNKYIAVSKEGTISIWPQDMKQSRSFKTGTDTCKGRDLWITHFCALQNINKLALAFTSKEISIYDMSTKLDFNCQYKIQGLPYTPLTLDYWSNPNNPNEALLVWGDVGGFVNVIFFNSANIALFERPPAPAGEKQAWQEPCLSVQLQDVIGEQTYKNAKYTVHEAHKKEWVRQVRYSQYLECFISCSTTNINSMVIGWMEKHTSVTPSKNQQISKEILRKSEFHIPQGINAFDYNQTLNLIATAGVNHHVCLWNPYVVSKPNGVLRGHMASVIQVHFMKSRAQLISFSKDKVLRIWDVQLQVCIQRLAGMFPKGPEVYSCLYFDEQRERSGLEKNRLLITFNYQLTMMEMKAEIRDRIMSHDKPVISAIYNTTYNQVVSVCQSGTLIIWMIDTGQKVKQFSSAHGNAEVTCLSQDPTGTKLFTGSTDGTVKMWDFNGHNSHSLECAGGQPADVGQVLNLKRSIVVVGWARYVTIFRDSALRDTGALFAQVTPSEWKGGQEHPEDILCCAFTAPNTMVTGSYDGEIVVWNTNSEQASRHLSQRSRRKMLKSRTKSIVSTTNRDVARVSETDAESRPRSRPNSRPKSTTNGGTKEEQKEFGFAVSRLIFLESRKTNSGGGSANLMSCGGSGMVRFWNTSTSSLAAEFQAHTNGSIIMATDKLNQWLVTGDADGLIKVWEITEYCMHSQTDVILKSSPPMKCQYQAHTDMINSIDMCERNERSLIITASSDCSVAVFDVRGNKIGVFGQEEHWKIETYDPAEELEDEEGNSEEEPEDEEEEELEVEVESVWEPDERAITEPGTHRINTWDSTCLGKNYQETRVRKRERKQPGTIPNLPYLTWEKTGQAPAGPYSHQNLGVGMPFDVHYMYRALETQVLLDFDPPSKPDVVSMTQTASHPINIPKLPALVDTLKQPVPEKEIFPKYILDFEAKMKSYHKMQLNQQLGGGLKGRLGVGGAGRTSLQNIGLQLGQHALKSPPKALNKSLKVGMRKPGSRRTSVSISEMS
ncbi:WD repeat-containing protein 49-like isoform X3 [Mizuhopecten yessoensis]|uniref:WD repeat-containing protein 49-like isoform X3 n=1 Tax=Mizuhopecten yessoensis TaxID=6573 RepID=UPI000B457B47|nr:WD repeat-containing protein 49-like isoform X3 [Mizuhopecten yessoensis]